MTHTGTVEIDLGGEALVLLPARAALRLSDRTLFVADLHLGKAASFRTLGVAVPGGTTSSTLERLDAVIAATSARRLVVLGDFLHARSGRQPRTEARLRLWRAGRPDIDMVLVRGNHDIRAGDPDSSLDIRVHDSPHRDRSLLLHHHPPVTVGGAWIAGHIHPGVQLAGPARQRLFLPCFHLRPSGLVLPAFGTFTGLAAIVPDPIDRIFAVTDDAVIEVERRS